MVLQAYQVQFGFTGPIFGAGTSVALLGVPAGIRELSPVRGGDVARTMEDGMLPGKNYAGTRTAQFDWETTLSPAGMETALASLAAQHAIVPDPALVSVTAADYLVHQAVGATPKPVSVMQVQLPGRASPILLFGRPSKFAAPIDINYQFGRVQPKSEWTIPDGLVYDGVVQTGSCGLPNPTSGAHFNATFNLGFGSSSGGSFTLTNAGNAPAPAVFVVQGPCLTPTIRNITTGEYITLNQTLDSTQKLTVDTKSQIVTLNTANRNSVVVVGSSFFKLAPGANTIQFSTIDSAAVAGTLTGLTLSAYSVL